MTEIELLIFGHAGGSPDPYEEFASGLPDNWHVRYMPISHRAIGHEEQINTWVDELRSARTRPVVVFGHSMGGVVAHRLSCLAGPGFIDAMLCLIVSSCFPEGYSNNFLLDELLERSYSESSFWTLLYDLIYLGGLPREITRDERMIKYAVDVYRADLRLLEQIERVQPRPIDAPIIYVGGSRDRTVSVSEASRQWEEMTGDAVVSHTVDGDHFYFVTKPEETCSIIVDSVASLLEGAPVAELGS